GTAGLLALALRRSPARARYALWLAASLKFVVPFSLLVWAGGHAPWRPVTAVRSSQARVEFLAAQVTQPFAAPQPTPRPQPVQSDEQLWTATLLMVWGCGVLVISLNWWLRWRGLR